jgi:exonuclease SbcC
VAERELATRSDEAHAKQDAARQANQAREEQAAHVRDLETRAATLRPLAAEEGARAEAAERLRNALAAARERDEIEASAGWLAKEVEDLQRQVASARDAASQARASAEALAAARDAGIAVSLAEGLAPGKPCPVCGALEHPAPARSPDRVPEKREVDEARGNAKHLEDHAADVSTRHAGAAAQLRDVRVRAVAARTAETRAVPLLDAEATAARKALEAARTASRDLQRATALLEKARQGLEGSAQASRKADDAAAVAASALASAKTRRDEVRRQVEAAGVGPDAREELASTEKELHRLEEALTSARSSRGAAEASLAAGKAAVAGCDKEIAAARTRAAKATEEAERACHAAGFENVAACEQALLPDDRRAELAASIEKRAVAARTAEMRVDSLEAELGAAVSPDLPAMTEARTAAAGDARAAHDAVAKLDHALGEIAGREKRVAELSAELTAIERRLEVVGHVADVANGRNGLNMSLQRFVLAARLEEVAEAASRRLLVMSKGRFQLRHDATVGHRAQAAGLGLVVEDAWTGVTDRPVGALSGGETFLASLALALGLSDVVLRRSGGLRLDALFVDEGFGSLDDETLDDAIRALEELREHGRLVGVISHVAELRRRIPARIEVKPSPEGSVAVVHPA